MERQEQFLNVIDRDEAERRFHAALCLNPCGTEMISLREAWGRILARDIRSPIDIPSFDRSNFDGFVLRAADTFGASEMAPKSVRLLAESLDAGTEPGIELQPGEAASIATGGMVPRGEIGRAHV